jgi:GNAT superfamily N-acetyltransferase
MPDLTGRLQIERLNAGNLSALATLHEAVYNRKTTRDYFEKKYDTTYAGVTHMGFIAFDQSQFPVAFYGVIPTQMWYKNEIILGAQSADTMTHPEYRGAGLFAKLAELTFELCKKYSIKLIFGFPNQNSLPGFINKLKWQKTENMDCFMISVKPYFRLQKIANKFSVLKSVFDFYQRLILKKYLLPNNGLENSAIANSFNGIFRDDDYLQYKTYSHTYTIKIGGSAFWIKLQNGLMIGDVDATPETFNNDMGKLLKLASTLGVDLVQFHSSPGTKLHSLFLQKYDPVNSFTIIFKDLIGNIETNMFKFTFADIDIF